MTAKATESREQREGQAAHRLTDRIFTGLLAVVCTAATAGVIFEAAFLGRIYPGVTVGGRNAGRLTFSQAAVLLEKSILTSRETEWVWGVNKWTVRAEDAGLVYDIKTTINQAAAIGRSGDLVADLRLKLGLWRRGVNVEPVFTTDPEKISGLVGLVAEQIDIPAKEPEISIENGLVTVSPGENGRRVDRSKLMDELLTRMVTISAAEIEIPVVELKPRLDESQAESARQRAAGLVGKKLILETNGETWEVQTEQLISWLDLPGNGWNRKKIGEWVAGLAETISKDPQNAVFRYVGEGKVEEFKPATAGVELLPEDTIEEVTGAADFLLAGMETEARVSPVTRSVPPEIDTGDVNNLGIKELIGRGESWYSGSITNRIFNLKKAAETISGTLVAPGEIFSFNQTVGEVSADTGYKQAYIIKEGKTILGDGGGVCQVSSTLFRAILAAGLPIEERVAHAYRVHYYEEKYQVGFDATVFQPKPDFRFRNDTGHYILIQAVYDEKAKYLAFELYGTADGRVVDISKSRVWEVTAPPPDLYIDDATLPVGKVVQTEHAAWGAKVAFDWKVTRGEEILQERTFYSNYKPWQAVFLRGTKPL